MEHSIFFDKNGRLVITGAQLLHGPFMNFSGEKRKYNDAGKRNFCVVIDDDEIIKQLNNPEPWAKDGLVHPWNVRVLKPRNEDEKPVHYIRVNVDYNGKFPPQVIRHIGETSFACNEANIGEIDHDYILDALVVINPYRSNGEKGPRTTGYLYSLDVDIQQNYYDKFHKTIDIPEVEDEDPFNK